MKTLARSIPTRKPYRSPDQLPAELVISAAGKCVASVHSQARGGKTTPPPPVPPVPPDPPGPPPPPEPPGPPLPVPVPVPAPPLPSTMVKSLPSRDVHAASTATGKSAVQRMS
ncbi:MAG TPA: hypothetical protein ENK57_00015 [Polyangiaceae bacterium]|nr:hypothetical protein [Polyangiaceae bacterium]